jgi:hypothetical protein
MPDPPATLANGDIKSPPKQVSTLIYEYIFEYKIR